MTHQSLAHLSDRDLLTETVRVADSCRRRTVDLIALLAEVEARGLHRGEGHSSLFTYCTEVLHLSEASAYCRIAAARAARRLPVIFRMLADGDVTLTTITRLGPHLTEENHEALLSAARHKGKDDIARLVASLDPQPDVPSSVRRLPAPRTEPPASNDFVMLANASSATEPASALRVPVPTARSVVAPIAPERYLVKITVSSETHAKLERARNLLRHVIPNGDAAAIVDRALTALIDQLERTKQAKARRPRSQEHRASQGRHVPAAVKRTVWARDEGRCAFVGRHGRCAETGFLELHHVVPFAAGGPTTAENLQLRCRSHNAYEAECWFGTELCPDRV
jgi:hypothetical protein